MSHITRMLGAALLFVPMLSSAQVKLQSSVTHVQPGCGLVLWPDNAEDRHSTYGSKIALEFQYALPCKVVTGKQNGQIVYDWTWLENILNDIAGRGHQAVIRWRYEYPSSKDVDGKKGTTAVPAYIKALPDYKETYSSNPGGDGPTYYADWSNSELQWFTKQFATDFAARYGTDSRIAFLEVGFGHWGEYHIYGTTLKLGTNFPSKQYQSEYLQHLDSVMPIPWLVSIDAADTDYSPIPDSPTLMGLTFGTFDDSFMHEGHEIGSKDGYNERNWRAIGSADNSANLTRWQTGASGGEVSYYEDSDQHNFLNTKGMYGYTWENQAAKYHITFMIANDAPEGKYGTAARFESAGMATGYKLQVVSASVSGTTTYLAVTNTGVAPLYRDAYFAIGNTRADISLRGLLPGDMRYLTIEAALTNTADLHVVSDYILPSQEIQYEADCTVGQGVGLQNRLAENSISKILENGRLIIQRGNEQYTVLGTAVK